MAQCHFHKGVPSGQNIRNKGKDIQSGQVVLNKGIRLQAIDVAVPSAVLITFCWLASPFLLRMQGPDSDSPIVFNVPADFEYPESGKHQEYLRAKIEQGEIAVFHNQSPDILASAS